MNEIKTSCASTDRKWSTWESIDWNKCEIAVNKLCESGVENSF